MDIKAPSQARSVWQVDVERRLIRLLPLTPEQEQLAAKARSTMAGRSLGSWPTGSREDMAHALVDAVERDRVPTSAEAADVEARTALASSVAIRVRQLFRAGDARRIAALELLKPPPSAAAIREALGVVHEGWSSLRRSQRAQRNRSLALAVGFALAVVAMAWALQSGIEGFTLAEPAIAQLAADAPPTPVPVVANAWVLAFLGMVGGLVSLLGMVRRTPNIARSSGGWVAQALLKVSSAGLLGVLGAWFLQTGLLDPIVPLDAGPLAAWAVLFGYSQDALTKRFDARLAAATPPATDTGTDDPDTAA